MGLRQYSFTHHCIAIALAKPTDCLALACCIIIGLIINVIIIISSSSMISQECMHRECFGVEA